MVVLVVMTVEVISVIGQVNVELWPVVEVSGEMVVGVVTGPVDDPVGTVPVDDPVGTVPVDEPVLQ